MNLFLSGIHQNTVAIDIPLIFNRLVRLSTIVESNRVGPNVLLSLAHLLSIVLPMHAVPKEVVVDAMFETGPDRGAGSVAGASITIAPAAGRPPL